MTIILKCRQWPHAEGLPLPSYQTGQAAGLDISAALPADRPLTLLPLARELVPTGLSLELPAGYECQIRPRSGLAARQGVTVLNSPGTVDADYRGEIMIILINLGAEPVTIARGDRIAQMVIAPVSRVEIAAVADLGQTPRGSGGFGSTGIAGLPSTGTGRSD